jgi:hypothetical protein
MRPLTATTELAAPTGASATPVHYDEANVTWTDNSSDEDGFDLTYGIDGSGTTSTVDVPPNGAGRATGYALIGLKEGTTYDVSITAIKGSIQSTAAQASFTTLTPEQDGATDDGEVTPSVSSGDVSNFGDEPAGTYMVEWVSGVVDFHNIATQGEPGIPGHIWGTNAGGQYQYDVQDGDNTIGLGGPGSSGDESTAEAAVAASPPSVTFTHTGSGPIGVFLFDTDYGDNGGDGATWKLVLLPPTTQTPTVSISTTADPGLLTQPMGDSIDNAFTISRSDPDDDYSSDLSVSLNPWLGTAILGTDYSLEYQPTGYVFPAGTPTEDQTAANIPTPPDPAALSGDSVDIPADYSGVTVMVQLLDSRQSNFTASIFGLLKASSAYTLGDSVAGPAAETQDGLDLEIDSNNDGVINSADAAIKDSPTLPGKYVNIDNTDLDNNEVPDFADGYTYTATDGTQDTATGETFVPLQLSIPASTNFNTAEIEFAYSDSDPLGVTVTKNNPTTAQAHPVPYTYTPAPASDGSPGYLRIWTKDGTVLRDGHSVASGGMYVPANVDVTPAQLGLSANNLSVTLYVEAVQADTANYWAHAPIEAKLANDGSNFASTDTVNTTVVYSEAGWKQLVYQKSGFNPYIWQPNLGYTFNHDDLAAIYTFYGTLYSQSVAAAGGNINAAKFEWPGLAKVAGANVMYGLQISTVSSAVAQLVQGLQTSNNPTFKGAFGGALQSLLTWTFTTNTVQEMMAVNAQTMKVSFGIFDDLAWNFEAYELGGIKEIQRQAALGTITSKAGVPGLDMLQAWQAIDMGTANGIWGGNLAIIQREQRIVAQPLLAPLNGMAIDSIPASAIITLFAGHFAPFPGCLDMADWENTFQVSGLFTNVDVRMQYIQYAWSLWQQLSPSTRSADVGVALP